MKEFKIFIVDDDIFYLNILQQYMINLGCQHITCFENGTDCLEQLKEKPHIVFLDYNMNVMTGYELLKNIKRIDPNIYVVMVSGQDDADTTVEVLKYGAFDYIQKGEKEAEKIKDVMTRILHVKNLLEQTKPNNFLRLLFSFL